MAIIRRLLLHGALWVAIVTALDAGTSWIMMTLRGASSEGNAAMRLLFESRDEPTLLTWASQQYVYFDLAVASILLYFLAVFEEKFAPRWLRETVFRGLYVVITMTTWFFTVLRLYYGPPGNTITILLPYGEAVALGGASGLFLLVLWAMLTDSRLFAILRMALQPKDGRAPGGR